MASISLGSMATGLPKDLVDRLIDAEREPIRKLEARKKNEDDKLKLAQNLSNRITEAQSGVNDLTTYRSFRDLKAVNARPEILDVSVDKNTAEPGNYQIEVTQLAGRSSMMSNGFADTNDTQVGAGYFSYDLPNGETKEVYIDPENSTLDGIARLINSSRGLDLNAIVVNDGTGSKEPFRLIVTHKNSGEANDAEFPSFYFVGGDVDFYLESERMAQNSVVKVNGFPVEFEGNKITSLLPGVTLDLKDAAPGKEFTLNIVEDNKSIKGKVETMVNKLNEILKFIQDQNKLDKDSNTRNTLGGDVTLQTLEYKIRQLVTTPRPTDQGTYRIADFGVQFGRDGLLALNGDKLERSLNENFSAVSDFFVGTVDGGEGFGAELKNSFQSMTRTDGTINSRVEGIKNRIKDIDKQIEMKEKQVQTTADSIRDKYARLEGTISKMKSQGGSLAGLGGGGALPGMG